MSPTHARNRYPERRSAVCRPLSTKSDVAIVKIASFSKGRHGQTKIKKKLFDTVYIEMKRTQTDMCTTQRHTKISHIGSDICKWTQSQDAESSYMAMHIIVIMPRTVPVILTANSFHFSFDSNLMSGSCGGEINQSIKLVHEYQLLKIVIKKKMYCISNCTLEKTQKLLQKIKY